MSLVYAGALSHAPGITGRAHLCENTTMLKASFGLVPVALRAVTTTSATTGR